MFPTLDILIQHHEVYVCFYWFSNAIIMWWIADLSRNSSTITSEGLPVLDALTVITRSLHNCRVLGYYGGIQKLTALMKGIFPSSNAELILSCVLGDLLLSLPLYVQIYLFVAFCLYRLVKHIGLSYADVMSFMLCLSIWIFFLH